MLLHRVCLLICLFALAAPAAAIAQSNPFGPINPAPLPAPAPEDTGEDTDVNEGEGELDGWQELAIFGGGGLLLIGIAWFVVRDARHRAPVDERHRRDDSILGASEKPKDPHAPRRKQVARQKGKAARKARKTTKRSR